MEWDVETGEVLTDADAHVPTADASNADAGASNACAGAAVAHDRVSVAAARAAVSVRGDMVAAVAVRILTTMEVSLTPVCGSLRRRDER
jgi:hypothetical protein